MASCGGAENWPSGLWLVVASCGELWRVVVGPKTGQVGCGEIVVPQLGLLEFVGELWRVVASCGELWRVVVSCGGAGINGDNHQNH